MGREYSLDELAAHIGAAIDGGCEQVSQMRYVWNASGNCERPRTVELYARPSGTEVSGHLMTPKGMGRLARMVWRKIDVQRGKNHPLWLLIETRCRKCYTCRRYRAALWTRRAIAETKAVGRTWFCTFTLNPDEHHRVFSECVMADANNGDVFEARSDDEQFIRRCDVIGRAITKYIKRVRKQSGAPLRYMIVAEKHKTGLPHYHALFHEVDPARPLRKAVLKGQWLLGFSDVKLVREPEQASYLCKYLSKDAAARVRGSLKYGMEVETTESHSVTVSRVKPDPLTIHGV